MIHAMAEYIWYKDRMWHYTDLLLELNRGVHFAILTDGQIVKHQDHTKVLYHAAGFNLASVGVELIVPGVYDLGALYSKINRKTMAFDVYTREQYKSIALLQGYLASHNFIRNPKIDWGLHSAHSQGRKRDPGYAFDTRHLKEVLDRHFI